MTSATYDQRPLAWGVAGLLLALMLPSLTALALDERLIAGTSLWWKPFHFQLSLILHFATIALLLPLVSDAWRGSRTVRWPVLAGATGTAVEILYIMLQAARGRASHFNQDTPLEAAAYIVMGVGAVSIVAASFAVGIALWRSPPVAGATGVQTGGALGLILGSVLTLVLAGYMSGLGSHLVGGPQTDAHGLPILGWATRGGDLRVSHFAATHLMQALPLVGLLADRLGPAAGRWLLPAATVAGVLVPVGLFVLALRGVPFCAGALCQ
jgi:hypothetical protein